MKIRNLILATGIVAAMLSATSCVNEEFADDKTGRKPSGEEVIVNLTYSVRALSADDATGAIDPQTRVVPDIDPNDGEGLPIKNMFIIQFDGILQNSKMIGAPRFLDSEDLVATTFSLPLIQNADPDDQYYTLFVANIPEGKNYNWNMSTQSSFADVVKRIKTITSEGGAHVKVGSTETLLVSAVTTTAVRSGTVLEPVFTRNVAKLTLNLKLENANIEIKSVRLRNVASNIVLADAALSKNSSDGLLPVTTDGLYTIDYNAVTSDMPIYNTTQKFSWYVPRNQQGVKTGSTGAVDKTFYAPNDATYFEIVAVGINGLNGTSVYRVYPGADATNDFNIISNHHYTVGLTVKGLGNEELDSRVESFDNVSYADNGGEGSKSNSFILNPAPKGGNSRTYEIPISQVNRYWNDNVTIAGYGKTEANMIKENDVWTISLIWCDDNGLFSDISVTDAICLDNNNPEGYDKGKGPDQSFRLKVPAGMSDGNFTLGIKKAGNDNYLWSWHFWVTDYNPNRFNTSVITSTPTTYTYPVPGGQVERYPSSASGKVMMDRALGMVSENLRRQPVNNMQGILHYQFGRKDPFPAVDNSNLNLQGRAIEIRTPGTQITIKESVAKPYMFVPIKESPYVWTSEANDMGYSWGDPSANNNVTKSIYDPCPPGWRLPGNGTWNDFNVQASGLYANTQNLLRDLGYNYGRGFGSASANVNGLRYWPGGTTNAPVNGTIWYPAAGYRNASTGALGGVGSGGNYWSSSPSSTAGGYGLSFYSGSVSPSNGSYGRAFGFSVRCVAE